MSNYLIKQGQKWSVKVAIPADVQGVFGKKAFKRSLKTSDKAVAAVRAAPLIAEFKDAIEEARGNPTQHLDDYLKHTQAVLKQARENPEADPEAISGIEEEVLERLLAAKGVRHAEELQGKAEEDVAQAYKVTTGQQTPFADPLEEYLESRKVEPKTAAKDRHAVEKFAAESVMIEDVDKQAVQSFVERLSVKEGLKNRTIKDNLSTLKVYWAWLAHRAYAPDDKVNPFTVAQLPPERRKDVAEAVRLPFSIEDVQRLWGAIEAGRSDTMRMAFLLAIYTGCRLEELTSLESANVTEDQIEIVRAKTAAGNRTIPVHDELKPLVRELKAKGNRYLIPGLSKNKYGARSSAISKQFGIVKKKLGYDSRFVFHSLRKTVTTLLEQSGVPESVSADILGHDKQTMTYGLYSGGSSMEQKLKAILALDYTMDASS